MNRSSPSKLLPPDIRARANRVAHAAGQRHEIESRARILADLERLTRSGADLNAMHAALDAAERTARS